METESGLSLGKSETSMNLTNISNSLEGFNLMLSLSLSFTDLILDNSEVTLSKYVDDIVEYLIKKRRLVVV